MFIYLSLLKRGRNNWREIKDKWSDGLKGYGHRKKNQALKKNINIFLKFSFIAFNLEPLSKMN